MATTPVPEARSQASGGRRFYLQRTLGEGAFGVVYLAEMEGQGGFRRHVALKLLNANWDPASDAGRRLRDEARLLGRLQHRHIVRVDDLVQLEGRWALVMEYIGGADLEVVFTLCKARGRLVPPRAVAELGVAVAAALGAAWTAPGPDGQPLRVIHRDIKPSNVRLSEKGDIKVLDFGVARAEFEGREAKTERVRYGSLGYMSPERLLGEPELPAGDVYALGVMLFELLTLDTYGRAELAPEKQGEQVGRADLQLAERLADGGGALRDAIRRCLAYRAEDRPSPMELEALLRAALRDAPGDDIHQFVQEAFPAIGILTPSGPDPVSGRVLEEHVTNVLEVPRPYATGGHTSTGAASGTLVLPADDIAAIEPVPAPTRRPLAIGVGIGLVAVIALGGWLSAGSPRTPSAPSDPVPPPVTAAVDPPVLAAPVAPPEVVPAPLPVNVVAPTPTVRPTTRAPTAAVTPAATPIAVPPAAVAPPESAPRLRAAKFTVTGADSLEVTCGDVRGSGITSALLRDFPAGTCSVTAGGHRTSLTVDSPRGIRCAVEGDALTCR